MSKFVEITLPDGTERVNVFTHWAFQPLWARLAWRRQTAAWLDFRRYGGKYEQQYYSTRRWGGTTKFFPMPE